MWNYIIILKNDVLNICYSIKSQLQIRWEFSISINTDIKSKLLSAKTTTVQALPKIIQYLKSKGYSFDTLH